MKFAELGLSATLLQAVGQEGYEIATPIQVQAIPPLLKGKDLMGCAQTGTGKTAALALPTIQRLAARLAELAKGDNELPAAPTHDNRDQRSGAGPGVGPARRGAPGSGSNNGPIGPPRRIRALVLAPTRELAAQIGESFRNYGRFSGIRNTVVFGGVSQVPQVRDLRFGVDVLIATPGRLLDLMDQGYIDLSHVETLILDEADQMLDMGFIVPLRKIIAKVPRRRQTLMFSATMPTEIRQLATEWLRDPVNIQVAAVSTPAERVQQSVFFVEPKQKPYVLVHFLKSTPHTRTLVFSRTKHGADKITRILNRAGIRAEAIHGNKSQGARQRVLQQFKSERPPVLVATDIAARGLDIDGVSHIVNFDVPEVPETYVHRIGRTARAGADGSAVSFCCREERFLLRQIERLIRATIPAVATPHVEVPVDDQQREPQNGNGGHRSEQRGPKPAGSKPAHAKSHSEGEPVHRDANGPSQGRRPAAGPPRGKRRRFRSSSRA